MDFNQLNESQGLDLFLFFFVLLARFIGACSSAVLVNTATSFSKLSFTLLISLKLTTASAAFKSSRKLSALNLDLSQINVRCRL